VVSVGVVYLEIVDKELLGLTLSEEVGQRDSACAVLCLFVFTFPDINAHDIVFKMVSQVGIHILLSHSNRTHVKVILDTVL
jgi:hypothetical protein